jgi:hypothetical protein
MSVHVAVDAHNLARDDRGIGRYARAVLSRAIGDADFRFSLVVRDLFPKRSAMAHALGGAQLDVVRRIPRDAQVVWFPWNGTFLQTGLPSVATVHDAAPFAYPSPDARIRATEQAPFLRTSSALHQDDAERDGDESDEIARADGFVQQQRGERESEHRR